MHATDATVTKPWKGPGMEGPVARWYTRTRRNDMDDFCQAARSVAGRLQPGSEVLEIAPGPGFFAIELAKLGDFKITGLDISRTFVQIASENAKNANLKIDFRHGNASAMPFEAKSFDFIYCSAAFKNFSEPVKALDEMYRVLRPGGEALIVDLRRDASISEIRTYINQSGRSRLDAWITRWTFRHFLVKRAYTKEEFMHMAKQSCFGTCRINAASVGLEVRLGRPAGVLGEAS